MMEIVGFLFPPESGFANAKKNTVQVNLWSGKTGKNGPFRLAGVICSSSSSSTGHSKVQQRRRRRLHTTMAPERRLPVVSVGGRQCFPLSDVDDDGQRWCQYGCFCWHWGLIPWWPSGMLMIAQLCKGVSARCEKVYPRKWGENNTRIGEKINNIIHPKHNEQCTAEHRDRPFRGQAWIYSRMWITGPVGGNRG